MRLLFIINTDYLVKKLKLEPQSEMSNPTTCNVPLQLASGYTESVTSAGDMHYCYLSLTSFSSSSEAQYMCTANINSYDEAASTTVTMSILGIVRLYYRQIQ